MSKDIRKISDEELDKVAGGDGEDMLCSCDGYSSPGEVQFVYGIGHEEEICDYNGLVRKGTHHAYVTKLGAFLLNGLYQPCYYFEGHEDIEGWYPESIVSRISQYNYADDSYFKGCNGCSITVIM